MRIIYYMMCLLKPVSLQNLPLLTWWGWLIVFAIVWALLIWLISMPWWGWTIMVLVTAIYLCGSGMISLMEGA